MREEIGISENQGDDLAPISLERKLTLQTAVLTLLGAITPEMDYEQINKVYTHWTENGFSERFNKLLERPDVRLLLKSSNDLNIAAEKICQLLKNEQ